MFPRCTGFGLVASLTYSLGSLLFRRARRLLAPAAVAAMVLAGCSNDTGEVSGAGTTAGASSTSTSAASTTPATTDALSAASTAPDATATTTVTNNDADESTETTSVVEDADLGAVGTLASGQVHDISIEFDQAEYDAMIATYTSSREKEWISATVTIDGTTYEQVGLRLKGNSSLMGVSADADPTTLPWLVKLDEYVEDQNHDGLEEFVIRSNGTETALNEAVALELLELSGIASQDAIAVRLSVNGGAPALRLVIDSPDGEWMSEWLTDTGALYKAESTGDWSYRGDDPALYDEVFDQEAGSDNADLTPLIDFLQFLNESDDATFAAELGGRLDVDAFATYLAMQELLDNFDDIDGPGNNAYLYYDTETDQFSVVAWDHNLAFGSLPGGMGGGGFPGDGDMPAPPEGFDPENMPTLPDGFDPGEMGGETGGGGPPNMNRANVLVDRFLANEEWNALYEQRLAELQAELYDSGTANSVLDQWSSIVATSGLVDQSTIDTEADAIAAYFS